MTQPSALKACTIKVRRAAQLVPCGTILRKKESELVCIGKSLHVNPMVTGFCNSGWHEGLKINKPTCKFWVTCPCDCHTQLARMFELAGMARPGAVDNSTYVADDGGFTRISLEDLVRESVAAAPNTRVLASPAPGLVPVVVEKTFAATATGRAPRGQLELWVREATDAWTMDPTENCTPQFVSDMIARRQGLDKGPSTGAVDAVFRRWTSYGFANIKSKPTRFAGYTIDGIRLGLDALKAKAKR